MQAVRAGRTLRRALPLAVLIVLVAAGSSYAYDDTGTVPDGKSSGGSDSGGIWTPPRPVTGSATPPVDRRPRTGP